MDDLTKVKTHRDRTYLTYLRTLPCLINEVLGGDSESVDPAHIGRGGRGIKSHDYHAIPLLHSEHLHSHNHGISRLRLALPGRHRVSIIELLTEAYPSDYGRLSASGLLAMDDADFLLGLQLYAKREYFRWQSAALQPFE